MSESFVGSSSSSSSVAGAASLATAVEKSWDLLAALDALRRPLAEMAAALFVRFPSRLANSWVAVAEVTLRAMFLRATDDVNADADHLL